MKKVFSISSDTGVVALEAMLIFPVFFLLVFGIIGANLLVSSRSTIRESLRAAARHAIVNGYTTGSGDCATAAQNEFQQLVSASILPVQVSGLSMSRSVQNGFPGILVTAQTATFCPGCGLFLPGSNLDQRTDNYFLPLELPNACPTIS